MLLYTINYAPNFKEVGGPYCFRVLRACIYSSRFLMHAISYETRVLGVLEFHSLLLKDLISDFYLPSLQLVLCSVPAVKRLPAHQP